MSDTDWVALAFIVFVGILFYFKVPRQVNAMLDDRAKAIAAELDQARELREEAQALLSSYQRKQAEAEEEAAAIVAQAETEAKAMAENARKQLAEQVERRTRLAETKIAQAEADAVKDVRDAAINVAVAATTSIIKDTSDDAADAARVDADIAALRTRLN